MHSLTKMFKYIYCQPDPHDKEYFIHPQHLLPPQDPRSIKPSLEFNAKILGKQSDGNDTNIIISKKYYSVIMPSRDCYHIENSNISRATVFKGDWDDNWKAFVIYYQRRIGKINLTNRYYLIYIDESITYSRGHFVLVQGDSIREIQKELSKYNKEQVRYQTLFQLDESATLYLIPSIYTIPLTTREKSKVEQSKDIVNETNKYAFTNEKEKTGDSSTERITNNTDNDPHKPNSKTQDNGTALQTVTNPTNKATSDVKKYYSDYSSDMNYVLKKHYEKVENSDMNVIDSNISEVQYIHVSDNKYLSNIVMTSKLNNRSLVTSISVKKFQNYYLLYCVGYDNFKRHRKLAIKTKVNKDTSEIFIQVDRHSKRISSGIHFFSTPTMKKVLACKSGLLKINRDGFLKLTNTGNYFSLEGDGYLYLLINNLKSVIVDENDYLKVDNYKASEIQYYTSHY